MTAALSSYVWWIDHLFILGAKLDTIARGTSSVVHFAAAGRHGKDRLLSTATLFGWLGAHGANLDAADHNGVIGLIISGARGDTAGVVCLLQNGAKPALKDHHGRTALHYALMRGLIDVRSPRQRHTTRNIRHIIIQLVEKGLEVNQQDLNGTTALMIASCSSWGKSLCSLLQEHRADASIISSDGPRIVLSPNGTVSHLVDAEGEPAKDDLALRYKAVLDGLLKQYVPNEAHPRGAGVFRYDPEDIKRRHWQVRMRIAANDDTIYDVDSKGD